VAKVGALIIRAGAIPIIPHFSYYIDKYFEFPYEKWMEIDFQLILSCDCLYRIPGYSPGADREMTHADINKIPVCCSEVALLKWIKENTPS
jgi:hypothetical protein